MRAWRPSRSARRLARRIRPDVRGCVSYATSFMRSALFAERPTHVWHPFPRLIPHSGTRKAITMKDAKTLLLDFLAAVTHGQDAAPLFAEDGALELPFLYSVGIPWRHQGRQAIRELQASLAGLYVDIGFLPEDTIVLID